MQNEPEVQQNTPNISDNIKYMIKRYSCDPNLDIKLVHIVYDILASVADDIHQYDKEWKILDLYIRFSKYGVPISDKDFKKLIYDIKDVFTEAAKIVYENEYYDILNNINEELHRYYNCATLIIDDSETKYLDDIKVILNIMSDKDFMVNKEKIERIFFILASILPYLII